MCYLAVVDGDRLVWPDLEDTYSTFELTLPSITEARIKEAGVMGA
jgi:hypothetical protein